MLIPSKLSRPVRLEHTVIRDRLLAKLSGANNYRLALITSPAGYGKTTLVSQWAAGMSDLGWYSLDEGDNQQERFASRGEYLAQKDTYILTTKKMQAAKKDLVVLHPLPRIDEIKLDVDSDPRAAYFDQVHNGVYIRMAIILALLGIPDPLTGKAVLNA